MSFIIPAVLVFGALAMFNVFQLRRLKRKQERLEADAMARGSIPPPLPKTFDAGRE